MSQVALAWLKRFAAACAAWTLLAYIYALQQMRVMAIMEEKPMPMWRMLRPALQTYFIFALLTVPLIEFARRIRFERRRWWRFAGIHLAGLVVFTAGLAVLRVLIFSAHNPRTDKLLLRSFQMVAMFFQIDFNDAIWVYFPMVAAATAYTVYVESRNRELAASQMQAELARAELQILKMQLHPHFLFNTLQAISTLTGKDPVKAKRMIALLGDLLRATIDRNGEQEIPLREELDILDRYVQIELTRFGERLRIEFEIAEDTLGAMVPGLILQPLVENAVRHGAGSVPGEGVVRVCASTHGGRLRISVADNGRGFEKSESEGGIGLQNTRDRLQGLYGTAQTLDFRNRESGGAEASIEIPLRLSEGRA